MAFHFLRNLRKSIYGGKNPKDCYLSFVFPATCSLSFLIPATMSTSPPTNWAVVPFECHAGKVGAIHFLRDFIVLFESLAKMIQVGVTNVLDGKVVNNECKHEGAPFVAPEPEGGGCLVVVDLGKAVLEEFVGKDACLGETVHDMAHFEVYPGVAGNFVELVLVDEFLGDVRKLDGDVLWPLERGVQIEILEVHGGKPGITLGENTVDKQCDEFN
jgi:hypothetical protein